MLRGKEPYRLRLGVVSLLTLGSIASLCQDQKAALNSNVKHGTINVVLGDKNGAVVLTDSMQTETDSQGHDHPDADHPVQKLFRIDENTVCAIAGFLSISSKLEIGARTNAVIAEYVRQQSELRNKQETLTVKLNRLVFMLNLRVNGMAQAILAEQPTFPVGSWRSQILLVGYDPDGQLRVAQVTLIPVLEQGSVVYRQFNLRYEEVSNHLVYFSGGMPDVADQIYAAPRKGMGAAITKYAEFKAKNMASDLSLQDMTNLAISLKDQTSLVHPEVGGDSQIATFTSVKASLGKVILNQRQFAPIAPAGSLSRLQNSDLSGMKIGLEGSVLYVNDVFHPINGWPCVITLDHGFFVRTRFINCTIVYQGGPFFFDESNLLENARLELSTNVDPDAEEVRQLRSLPWISVTVLK